MTNITGDKMMSHIGRVAGDHRPITADVFLTNYCNNKCPYCTYGRWNIPKIGQHVSFSDFVRYAKRLIDLGVQGIILTGGGEPTIHPNFRDITRWMEENGIHYGVNTNYNMPVFIKPDYLKVSLDAWDEDSYERSRGVRAYEKVKGNIASYASWKKENSPETSLGIQMVVENAEDVEKFWNANKDLDVDYIVFRPMESTGGQYYLHEFVEKEVEDISRAIEDVTQKDSRVVRNFKWDLLGQREKDCTAQWAQIAVNELGEVMYCCHKPYEIVGHIMQEDILERKKKAETDMKMCDVPCRMTAPNMFVAETERERENSCFI